MSIGFSTYIFIIQLEIQIISTSSFKQAQKKHMNGQKAPNEQKATNFVLKRVLKFETSKRISLRFNLGLRFPLVLKHSAFLKIFQKVGIVSVSLKNFSLVLVIETCPHCFGSFFLNRVQIGRNVLKYSSLQISLYPQSIGV
eukprot:TRINITY_DN29559_c0_g2_i1.p3 TRINITY_DN29559_c0_g2~~TRINITY_DN29559_c0_g2_i1.p3  ORF type:complete len:141 (+),score=0.72 TRINITY_DN29559_c0_g2_i1:220-642(+)